jgi:hypothetical protein
MVNQLDEKPKASYILLRLAYGEACGSVVGFKDKNGRACYLEVSGGERESEGQLPARRLEQGLRHSSALRGFSLYSFGT